MPPCFGALHCTVVQGFRLTLAPRSWRQGGGAGVYSGSFPVWASADVPDFPKLLRLMPEVTPPCASVHSPPDAACRPAKPRAWRLKTATTLPGGKAAGSLRLRRADRKGHQKWRRKQDAKRTSFTRKRTVCLLNRALLGIFRTDNKEMLLFITAYFLFLFLTKKDISR